MQPTKPFLADTRAFSIVECAAKARPQISSCSSVISSILHRNEIDLCGPLMIWLFELSELCRPGLASIHPYACRLCAQFGFSVIN